MNKKKKKAEKAVCFAVCSAVLSGTFAEPVFAGPIVSAVGDSSEEEIDADAQKARSILEKISVKIDKGKEVQKVTLLGQQRFDIKKEDFDYVVVSADDGLTVLDGGEIYAKEIGNYTALVCYKDYGFVTYEFDVREPESCDNTNLTMTTGTESSLDIESKDLAVYSSSDEDVVSVTEDGVLQAHKGGQATVTVIINDYQAITFSVNVTQTFPYYTQSELDLIYAIVQQECATSYEGALAVISCAYNRSQDANYGSRGADPLSQLKLEGQFCYSLDNYWKRYLGGNVNDNIKNAVNDCLFYGKTNHNFLSYRGFEIEGATEFDGNWYF